MHSTLPQWLIEIDHRVWFYLNTRWHTPVLDTVMPFLRNQWFWAPLYLFLLLFMPRTFGKYGWLWCAGFLVTFGLSDQLSAHLIKPIFGRLRPCNDPFLAPITHLLVDCGSGKSFPSSHAANHFALAVFSGVTLAHMARWVWLAGLLWAASVAYAQVYVGVHFPLDVTVGGLLGAGVGLLTGKLFNNRFRLSL
ncbi:MAG: phosphatase PAP2 family protein [Flavipsychrobacter sp.]|nr:phosphatase PAP2 family protein [Flavipsychrobacter sp.]